MLLKKLEIYGFKSFADRTILEFEPGITSIVGPNGCGKSNIVDAIKWVLGEQSPKELRGSSMEDVIFNGTEFTERVNFAEVTLVISNEDGALPLDFSEVSITRRLFRTSDSEYFINRVPVRLKDVQELIAGTGVGTQAYSLMEQGKIDLILSSKPEERRFVFEEASGITKFKNKKKEALRKLEHTENNLLRISDVIAEVRRQISTLERQARKAEKYKIIYEELKAKEIKQAGYNIKQAKELISSYSAQKEKIEQEYESLTRLLEEKEAGLRKTRNLISSLSEEIGKRENLIQELKSNIQRNQERVEWDNETIIENRTKLQVLELELKEINKRKEDFQAKLTEAEKELSYFQEQAEKILTQLAQKQSEDSTLAQRQNFLKVEIEDLKSQNLDLNFELTQKRNLVLELQVEIKSLKNRLQRYSQEHKDTLVQIEQEDNKISNLSKDVQNLEIKSKAIDDKLKNLNQNKSMLLEKKDCLEKESKEIDKELAISTTLLSSWQEMYTKGISYLEWIELIKQKLPKGFYGLCSELIKVNPEYLSVVEFALRRYLTALVVESRDSALKLLSILRDEGIVDINIIILEEIDEIKIGENIKDAIPLINFIEIKPEFTQLLYFIKDTYYVSDYDKAKELSLDFPQLKFVAPDNIMFKKGEIELGPNPAQDLGYLDRESKIKKLKDSIQALKDSLLKLSGAKQKLNNEILNLDNELALEEKESKMINYNLVVLRKTLETHQASKNRLLEEKEVLDLDIEEIKTQLENDISRVARLKAEIEQKEAQLQEFETRLSSIQKELNEIIDTRHRISLQLVEFEAKASACNERKEQFYAWYKSLKTESENINKDGEKREKDYNETTFKIAQLEKEIEKLEQENTELKMRLKQNEASLEEEKINYQEQRNNFEKEEEILVTMRNQYTAGRDEIYNLELKINDEEYKIKSLKERLSQLYNVLEIPELELAQEVSHAIAGEIQQLQEKLRTIGEVNLVAIEEYKRLQERLSFLEVQEKDLVSGKESLISAIREINKTTRELFLHTFGQVNKTFKEIFPRLFGGGDAELILEQGIDCLEAGIEILARPPGRKLQSVSLLSGGEKALTALALLFSIFKVRPSPFCILDEVDAPLDEANIDRFRKLLEEFAKLSQFLVITHSKRTISTADVIYGITMEDSGISKIVSVKFQKVKEAEVS